MAQGRNRWLVRISLVVVVAAGLFLWYLHERSQNVLTIENHAEQPIASLEVTLAGQTSSFRNVPPGGAVAAPFGTKEDHDVVEGRLADGTLIHGQFGHLSNSITSGAVHLIVLPGGRLLIRQSGKG